MKRRDFLHIGLLGGAAALARTMPLRADDGAAADAVSRAGHGAAANATAASRAANAAARHVAPRAFEFDEATIADLSAWMASGRHTARSIAAAYLARIEEIDRGGPAINSVIEINPDALAIADALDAERRAGRVRGPMHGIPVLLKDNIDTADRMMTTAGSLALAGAAPARDAFVAQRLRQAGAVILGKTNLSEWANFRSTHSTSGWSGRGGQTRNPYALDRNPCGSSSGSGAAIAASLCAVAVGTETDGSIVCPATMNGIVGIKPTLGLVSRAGIIPIAHSQDTAGPMARSVADAAILLAALAGADDRDAVTRAGRGKFAAEIAPLLDAGALRGARIGVARNFFGFSDAVDRILEGAIREMRRAGATIIDPANIATDGQFNDSEYEVLLYEFKADLNKYLAARAGGAGGGGARDGVASAANGGARGNGAHAPMRSLADLIAYNDANRNREMPYFGQEIFLMAQEKGPLSSRAYIAALKKNHKLSRAEGIDAVMNAHNLDAIFAPTGGPAWTTDLINGDHYSGGCSSPAAVAGYPHVTVPAGQIFGLPVGVSFFGRAWSEPALIRIAYAFEQVTRARHAPRFLPSAELSA
ncbi:MAG: amidase family protein [bacterium]